MQGIFGEQERELNDCICTSHPSLFTTYTLEPRRLEIGKIIQPRGSAANAVIRTHAQLDDVRSPFAPARRLKGECTVRGHGKWDLYGHSLLFGFISDLNLFVCDLPFKNSVGFIYEGSQGFPPSWIDHVPCSASYYSLVTDVASLRCGQILSDHFPLCFSLAVECFHEKSCL